MEKTFANVNDEIAYLREQKNEIAQRIRALQRKKVGSGDIRLEYREKAKRKSRYIPEYEWVISVDTCDLHHETPSRRLAIIRGDDKDDVIKKFFMLVEDSINLKSKLIEEGYYVID